MPPSTSPSIAIVSAVRTPIGRYLGSLRELPATELGGLAARAALERAHLAPSDIDEVLFGHCIQASVGQNPARQVLRAARIPDTSGATTINMVCGSGMKAVHLGISEILAGHAKVVLVGGMESMSRAPYLVPGEVRWGVHFGERVLDDAMQQDALRDAYAEHELMGLTGERIAAKFHLTRAEVDAYALRSNQRADEARREGRFADELVPVPPGPQRGSTGLDHDECVRADTTLEGLAQLRLAFDPRGVVTAGNASKLSDGAAALVLMETEDADRRGIPILAKVHSTAVSGIAPGDVMEAPIPTVRKHLAQIGLKATDFDLVEHNEAYASASLAVQRTFGFADDHFNVNGGAVALGHPIGASGARIVVTLLHALRQRHGRLGLATLCMGGGNGLSTVIERTSS